MQRILRIQIMGTAGMQQLRMQVWIGTSEVHGQWVELDQLAQHNLRVVQVFRHDVAGWAAIVEEAQT